MAAWALLHEGLLVRAVQLLGELDGLQGCQAAGHAVDDRDTLSLGGVEALCNGHDSREGRHDEVLRLLRIVVGQAVDIRQGADGGKPPPETEIILPSGERRLWPGSRLAGETCCKTDWLVTMALLPW